MAEGKDEQASASSGGGAAWALSSAGREAAEAYLHEQTRLAHLQAEELIREDAIRHWSLRFSHASTVMKFIFELSLALVCLALAAIVASALWSASHANGLVIEAFQVPGSLAERGLSGQVVATRLLDKLSGLQDKTDSLRAPNSYANNWGDDIKVQIPDTGVSIGELNHYLRQWLGHETHITGEIWREGDGFAVVARAGADEGTVFSGKESELDALIEKATEDVFRNTQPYRYAVYLMQRNEAAPALSLLRNLIATSPPSEQAWALAVESNQALVEGDFPGMIALNSRAIALDPSNALAPENRAEAERELNWDEAALRDFRKTYELVHSGRSDINPAKVPVAERVARTQVAERLGDFQTAVTLLREVEELPNYGGSTTRSRALELMDRGWSHDRAMVAQMAQAPLPANPADVYDRVYHQTLAQFLAGERESAIRSYDALLVLAQKTPDFARGFVIQSDIRQPLAFYAHALAEKGDFRDADAGIAKTPADCDTCMRMRGAIAALEKQWARSDFWFAHAEAHAPSVPFADADWGNALLARGDTKSAIAKFTLSNDRGPHFADPLEGWGEALMAQNRSDLALAKFEEADRDAPNWCRLHLKWGEALLYTGQKHEAAKQFAIGAGLAPDVAESAELSHMRSRA